MPVPLRLLAALTLPVLSSFSLRLAAQDSPRTPLTTVTSSCPLQFKSLEIHGDRLTVAYRDNVNIDQQGIKFGLVYYDAVQDSHRILVLGGDNHLLRVDHVRKTALDIKYWRNTGYTGWTIWPYKILFKDGTTWTMSQASTGCRIEKWNNPQIAHPQIADSILLQEVEPSPERHR